MIYKSHEHILFKAEQINFMETLKGKKEKISLTKFFVPLDFKSDGK